MHDLKTQAWPQSRDVPHWRAGARLHRDEAREAYAPSMDRCEKLAVERLCRRALRGLPETLDGAPPQALPEAPDFTLAQLLAPVPDESE